MSIDDSFLYVINDDDSDRRLCVYSKREGYAFLKSCVVPDMAMGLTVDDEYVYVGDYRNRSMHKYTKQTLTVQIGQDIGTFNATESSAKGSLCVDNNNYVYQAEINQHQVSVFTKPNVMTPSFIVTDSLKSPFGIVVDDMFVYVSDQEQNCVILFYK
jgi:hypothetical protein